MPKELVCGCNRIYSGESDAEPETPVVDVRWNRETGYCQIATRLKEAEAFSSNTDDPIPVEYGYYVDLDRRGINQLIRNLRRARDQAFGRDE